MTDASRLQRGWRGWVNFDFLELIDTITPSRPQIPDSRIYCPFIQNTGILGVKNRFADVFQSFKIFLLGLNSFKVMVHFIGRNKLYS